MPPAPDYAPDILSCRRKTIPLLQIRCALDELGDSLASAKGALHPDTTHRLRQYLRDARQCLERAERLAGEMED
jgi:hypothetical protein